MLGQRRRAAGSYRASIITHQRYSLLSHFGHTRRSVQLSVSLYRSLRGSYRTAALFDVFTMRSGVLLLLLAAVACGLAQEGENAAEELQVETLVCETRVSQCNGAAPTQ